MSSPTPGRGRESHDPDRDEPGTNRGDAPEDDSFDIGPGGDPRHPDQPDPPPAPSSTRSSLPDHGIDDATVEALGLLSEAVEWVERARGRLYDFHQLTGHADEILGRAADALDVAGHDRWGRAIRNELVGRNVLEGRWTFQVVEEYDDSYWSPVRSLRAEAEQAIAGGRRHVYEERLKERRRTHGRRHHEAHPIEPAG
jgi:hypothetical protein